MALQRHDANKIDKKKLFFFVSADDFAPVLSLSQQDIFVLPIQLPAMITGKDNTELRQTLTTLRRAHMEKFVLHSMKRDVVKHVINAVISFHNLYYSYTCERLLIIN